MEGGIVQLSEETARHVVQVLRMTVNESLLLTDGKGAEAHAIIDAAGKKTCSVRLESLRRHEPLASPLHLAVAFTKNTARNEWLLEKATELGVQRITPLITARSVRERIREDRWRGILVSALLQSQQFHLPQLDSPASVEQLLTDSDATAKLIAHCLNEPQRAPLATLLKAGEKTLLLIGPEGDFTPAEVTLAMTHGFRGVLLGPTRLRTETAAIAACAVHHLLTR